MESHCSCQSYIHGYKIVRMEGNMSNNQSTVLRFTIAGIVALAGIGLAVFALNNPKDSDTTDNKSPADSTSRSTTKVTVGSTVITFTDDGFEKREYTSQAGEAVTVRNASSM